MDPAISQPDARQIEFNDPDRFREVAGELGRHLALVGKNTGARVSHRGGVVRLAGAEADTELAAAILRELYALAGTGIHLTPIDVDQACRLLRAEPQARLLEYHADTVLVGTRKKAIYPRTPMQRAYIRAFASNDIVFGLGPAGTGKTYLAMAVAVAALLKEHVRRIVLVRPAVEAGEKLGFLPGDIAEKVNPYLRPLYDALYDMVDGERADRLVERGVVEVAPLAFMRGRTLNDAFIILDEAQNATEEQMKMFLTRLGNESKAAVTGDLTQMDLPRGVRSGLAQATCILDGVEGIGMVRFTDADIVRHPLVSEIVRAYDRDAARTAGPAGAARTNGPA
ncbi:MAG: PhoH family protein [Deltaproteobacteria bacterium]|nr:PhoH family protein [Deltaproteobacteria bacterium]